MITKVKTFRINGIEAVPCTVEVSVESGIGIRLVGLADSQVKECLLRTVTALQSLGYGIPGKKLIINITPADILKGGSGFDLPIALGILAASGQANLPGLESTIVAGELGLDGSVRQIGGGFPAAVLAAGTKGTNAIILPAGSAAECEPGHPAVDVHAVGSLADAVSVLSGQKRDDLLIGNARSQTRPVEIDSDPVNLADIAGNEGAKRAVEIAAAGGHHLLIIGAPGSGKERLARALNGLLPVPGQKECDTMTSVASVSRPSHPGPVKKRPFRAPHYSASIVSMFGGGGDVLPGEVTLATGGTLYLEDANLFPRSVQEALRGPLEDREVRIRRLRGVTTYPSDFRLVAAMAPCPCGHYGEGDRCTCTPGQKAAYMSRLSGTLADHIDLQVFVHQARAVPGDRDKAESSAIVRQRVARAIAAQENRYEGTGIRSNSELKSQNIVTYCRLGDEEKDLIEKIITRLGLSARSYSRILKIARTIADLEGSEDIRPGHLAEAASYRFLDRTAATIL